MGEVALVLSPVRQTQVNAAIPSNHLGTLQNTDAWLRPQDSDLIGWETTYLGSGLF